VAFTPLPATLIGMHSTAKAIPRYLQNGLREVLPGPTRRLLRQVLNLVMLLKGRARLAVGVQPLSQRWGFDRGVPIHRSYLEQFLRAFSSDIHGHCLEFQQDAYTTRFGGSAITKLDILHIDDSNPKATIAADLTKSNKIPSNYFNCIICTHTLHLIFEVDKAVSQLYRILKPNGTLLVAVPHVSMYDPVQHEFWRFTPEGLNMVLSKVFGSKNVIVQAYGNSLTAAGEIRGLVVREFTQAELSWHDLRFAVEVCARAVKRTEVGTSSQRSKPD
jgi:SAM-dependent methyltransferase